MSLPDNKQRTGTKTNLLARVTANELRSIRVALRRTNVTASDSSTMVQRSIEDPKSLIPIIHFRKDGQRKFRALFDRDYIVVNQEDELLGLPELEESQTTRSYSRSSRSATPRSDRREKSRSLDRRYSPDRKKDPKGSIERLNDRNQSRYKEIQRSSERIRSRSNNRSLERPRDRNYRHSEHSREQEPGYKRRSVTPPLRPDISGRERGLKKRSITPPLRPDISGRESRRSKERDYHKHRRSRSTSRNRSKTSSNSRKPLSPVNHRPGPSRRSSRSPRRSISPSRADRVARSRYGDRRRSRSPYDTSKRYYAEKRERRSLEKYRSRSPHKYEDRKRSRSPLYSPSKYDKLSSRKRSRSPGYYERIAVDRRRSRSPQRSRRPDFRRSRSGERRYRQEKEKRRSRSHSLSRPKEPREVEFAFYEGIPGAEYWIPPPIRPGFPAMHRFYPPPAAFYPGLRLPIIPPRPRMHVPYPAFPLRLPQYNSKKIKPATQISTVTENSQNTSETVDASTSKESEDKGVIENKTNNTDNRDINNQIVDDKEKETEQKQ